MTTDPIRNIRKSRDCAAALAVIALVGAAAFAYLGHVVSAAAFSVATVGWVGAWKALGLAEEWALEAVEHEVPGGG